MHTSSSDALHLPIDRHKELIYTERMHELSIAQNLIEMAESSACEAGATQVTQLNLRLGRMSGVVKESLLFCFDVATEGTLLEGATLEIEDIPIVVYCPTCQEEVALPGTQRFRCPTCDTPTPHIIQGREMQLTSIEVV